ncbi:MAG: hypothetical protein KDH96_08790 [Candidatus Riesia sp.]|nr:hypothetical protein [Candidatus Riesia sp.]
MTFNTNGFKFLDLNRSIYHGFVAKKNVLSFFEHSSSIPTRLALWAEAGGFAEGFWFAVDKASSPRRRKIYVSKCSNRVLTTAG